MAWFYILIASVLEICWMYCVKMIGQYKLISYPWTEFIYEDFRLLNLGPLLGYIVFGVANIYFFSLSTRYIPVSTAFGVWMGMALVGAKLIDSLYFKEPSSILQIASMAFILIGIIGLKLSENQVAN